MKKRLGASLDALHSLTAETAVLAPVAVGVLVWLEVTGATTFAQHAPLHPLLLAAVRRRHRRPAAAVRRRRAPGAAGDDRAAAVRHARSCS